MGFIRQNRLAKQGTICWSQSTSPDIDLEMGYQHGVMEKVSLVWVERDVAEPVLEGGKAAFEMRRSKYGF